MTKTLIFDFDGTIADTFSSSIDIINSLSGKYGFHTFENDERNTLRSKSMKEILKNLHIPLFKVPFLIKDFTSLAQKTMQLQHPITRMPQLLKELHDNSYSLNIITSNSVANVNLFLKKHSLSYFNHIHSEKSLFGKHVVISKFLRKYRIRNDEALYIGDEIRDIEAAHKAKMRIIAVAWGFNSEEALNPYHPDYLVNQPKQISDILNKINSQ